MDFLDHSVLTESSDDHTALEEAEFDDCITEMGEAQPEISKLSPKRSSSQMQMAAS
jgi:hypothetical protein